MRERKSRRKSRVHWGSSLPWMDHLLISCNVYVHVTIKNEEKKVRIFHTIVGLHTWSNQLSSWHSQTHFYFNFIFSFRLIKHTQRHTSSRERIPSYLFKCIYDSFLICIHQKPWISSKKQKPWIPSTSDQSLCSLFGSSCKR